MSFAENGGMSPADVAAVMGNGNSNGFGWGGDGAWWLIILFLFMFNGNWNNGFGAGGNAAPYMVDNSVQRGFDQSAVMGAIQGVQNAVISGNSDNALGLANLGQSVMSQGYQGQIAMMQGFNNMQSQFADCCCENRLGIANLGADIAREACSDRQAVSELGMNLAAQNNQNTNAIINTVNERFNSLEKQNYLDKIDAKNDEIAQLRQEVLFARGQASQISQNEQIVNSIYNRLDTCPVGTTPVYGRTPIFNCNNNGCGCGVA